MDINKGECSKNFKCWECNENCSIKLLLQLPEDFFMRTLNACRGPMFSALLLSGNSAEKANQEVSIKTLTLYTTRMKYLEVHNK